MSTYATSTTAHPAWDRARQTGRVNQITDEGRIPGGHSGGTERALAPALALAGVAGAAWLVGMVYVIAGWALPG
jgi:hypothetical protein